MSLIRRNVTRRCAPQYARRRQSTSPQIKIVEVSPRDGLQNESTVLEPSIRAALIARLAGHGFKHIEGGSFVSPKLKQMAGTDAVLSDPALQSIPKDASLSVLVPNMRGFAKLHDTIANNAGQVSEVAVFVAATEAFSKANLNASVSDSLNRAAEVAAAARKHGFHVRGYASCVVGCPFEGLVTSERVRPIARALLEMGCDEISLGDTIGVGTPRAIEEMLNAVVASVPLGQVAMHCHDTYGCAIANVLHSARLGVHVFDSSVAGLGGCPFAPGASGNVSTEDLVYALEHEGYDTGLTSRREEGGVGQALLPLAETGQWISERLGKHSNSKVGRALLAKHAATQASML